jgi:hypothetical protein
MPDIKPLLALEEQSHHQLSLLWHDIQEHAKLKRPAALLHHISYAQAKRRNVRSMTQRVSEQFAAMKALDQAVWQDRQRPQGGFSQAATDQGKFRDYMRIDVEHIYKAAGILLDQFAMISVLSAGDKTFNGLNFNKLVDTDSKKHPDNMLSRLIHSRFEKDLLWLRAHVLIYRDNFLIHYERPWQGGLMEYQDDVSLMASMPPDWAGTEEVGKYESDILDFAGTTKHGLTADYTRETVRDISENPRYIFDRMMWQFDEFDATEQGELTRIAKGFGFTAPPFSMLIQRLFSFIKDATALVREYRAANPDQVNLSMGEGINAPFPIPDWVQAMQSVTVTAS